MTLLLRLAATKKKKLRLRPPTLRPLLYFFVTSSLRLAVAQPPKIKLRPLEQGGLHLRETPTLGNRPLFLHTPRPGAEPAP
jgi:hypothetical protein